MSTNQPFSDTSVLPVIESVLGTAPPTLVANPSRDADDHVAEWKTLEDRVAGWRPVSGEPDLRTDEDGYLLPGSKTVAVALQIAARLREGGVGVPLRLGQTANGGISFEWRTRNRTERLTVNARGETELVRFEDSKLVARKPIHFLATHQ